jgi:hypothetical protein
MHFFKEIHYLKNFHSSFEIEMFVNITVLILLG